MSTEEQKEQSSQLIRTLLINIGPSEVKAGLKSTKTIEQLVKPETTEKQKASLKRVLDHMIAGGLVMEENGVYSLTSLGNDAGMMAYLEEHFGPELGGILSRIALMK